jgi:two-component system nitrogen regulation response regulator NtrX
MPGEHILIVDDERAIQTTLRGVLEDEGYRVTAVGSGEQALARLQEDTPDIIFLDIWMPGLDGLDTLAEMKRLRPETAVVMISGHGTIETAVKATKLGAYDFIEKPLSLEKTLLTATRALEHTRLERENRNLRAQLERGQEIVGKSPLIEHLRQQIAVAAPSSGRVLIQGENGSGKELVARAIHALSARRDGPFVEVNCAAIPEELIESELFGHERGAFTGAVARRRGKFELADQGTLFLDEVGDMSLKTQAKVLRALEEQAFERVGGKDTIRVDVRVLAASNQDLLERIAAGGFREDLYYRLNVIPITLPPLRDRREDLPLLVDHFLQELSVSLNRRIDGLSADAMKLLVSHDWPGNVRELRNLMERAAVVAAGRIIDAADLGLVSVPGTPVPETSPPTLDEVERRHVAHVLRHAGGNVSQAARILDIDRVTLYHKIRKYGLKKDDDGVPAG